MKRKRHTLTIGPYAFSRSHRELGDAHSHPIELQSRRHLSSRLSGDHQP